MKNSIERRMDIVTLVNKQNSVRVENLAEYFGVSTVTIRNDLSFLEKNGYIIRSHGAAMTNKGLIAELTHTEKRQRNRHLKSRIAAAAVHFISDNESIILDSGTTTREIAICLKQSNFNNLLVMTNGLDVAVELAKTSGIDILATGGNLRKQALSFSGRQAEASLRALHFDKVFLGVDGFDLKVGITTHNEDEANLNRLMCDLSDKVIAVSDSSKFGKKSCHVIRSAFEIDTLITDSGIPDEYINELRNQGVDVIIIDKP